MTGQGKVVALFRAMRDARLTAARLREQDFDAAIAPVTEPVPVFATAPEGAFAVVAVTSAKAFEFAPPSLLQRSRDLPILVVGAAGRRSVENAGLLVAREVRDAASLARELTAVVPKGGRVLYLAGVDRRPEFEAALLAAGIHVTPVEVYEARARKAWSADEAASVASAEAALHYSRRSAEIATTLAGAAGLSAHWLRLRHIAISEDVAATLRDFGAAEVAVAAAPNELAMYDALARTFASTRTPPPVENAVAAPQQGSLRGGPPLYTDRSQERAGMAEETIQDDHPAMPPASVPKPEREPVTIDGEAVDLEPQKEPAEPADLEEPIAARETDLDEPSAASAQRFAESLKARSFEDPPAATGPSRLGAFVIGGVGALLGAAVVFAGTYIFAPSGRDDEALTRQISALNAANASEASAQKALEARLATLEAKPAQSANSPQLSALEARLAKLESGSIKAEALLAVAEDAKAARAQADKAAAAVATIGAASDSSTSGNSAAGIAKLVEDQQSLGDRISKLEETVAAAKSAPPAADPQVGQLLGDQKALADRIGKLEVALAAPKSEGRADPAVGAQGDPIAQAIAALALERPLLSGQPYSVELSALEKLGADPKALAALKPYASAGAPTAATLAASFAKLAPTLVASEKPAAQGNAADGLWDEVKGLVKVHPVGEVKGDDPAALVTQVSAALSRADLAAARAAFAKLPEGERAASASWSKDLDGAADARAAALSLIETPLSRFTAQKN